ncbi:hypothetical protein DM806_24005 [Sphingobium lactosutens]|uniref:hypothetical protein n=1 Tax=Sphingobium lactosutens TaxID=522773 RepID=UPI0015C19E86|nr:hypothetical protein [Sphingobium lactosutens]NWK98670.1 hypothetical protein [Sphingobium lactosutens]
MIDQEEVRALYEQGLNDVEIGRRAGCPRHTIANWRRKNGLATRHPPRPGPPLEMRRLLHDLGWGAKSIAKYEGTSEASVREWKKTHGLKANDPSIRATSKDRDRQLRDLQRRVVRAVGTRLPLDIAADAAAELMLAVIEGAVPMNEIERQARKFGNKALDQYANAFKQRSLDENIRGTDGLREIDLLVDQSASDWLEDVGATMH